MGTNLHKWRHPSWAPCRLDKYTCSFLQCSRMCHLHTDYFRIRQCLREKKKPFSTTLHTLRRMAFQRKDPSASTVSSFFEERVLLKSRTIIKQNCIRCSIFLRKYSSWWMNYFPKEPIRPRKTCIPPSLENSARSRASSEKNPVDQRISTPLQRDVYTGEPKLQITESSQKTIS